ncbi:hypothetical protein NDA03_03805 [Trichocoleus sp. Lan]|uniref:hypothetical protein n=1 Tax=Trichocoleus sp. Lan TaxID=2933927 RepID=UPI0032986F63
MRSLIHSLPTLTASLATPQCVAVTAVWAIAFFLIVRSRLTQHGNRRIHRLRSSRANFRHD